MWCVRNDAPNVFKVFFLFSVHWQTWTFFFLVCAWCVLKQLFTSIPVTVMVIYFAAPWLSKKYLSTSISANNCLLSRWLLDLAVYEDKPFYSWARNSHSERKKILLFPSTYTKLDFFSSDIPVIPDLEDVQEEDMMTQIAAPPRWDVTLPTGDGGGGIDRYSCDPRLRVCTRRGHGDTYCGPTQVGCCFTHGGGGGGGLQEFPKSGPTLAFFVLIKGHTTIFLPFFWGGGGGMGANCTVKLVKWILCEGNRSRFKGNSLKQK